MNKQAILQEMYDSAFKDELMKTSGYQNIDNELEKDAIFRPVRFVSRLLQKRSGTVLKRGQRVFDRTVRDAGSQLPELQSAATTANKTLAPLIKRHSSLTSKAGRLGEQGILERQTLIGGRVGNYISNLSKRFRTNRLAKNQTQLQSVGTVLKEQQDIAGRANRALVREQTKVQPRIDAATAAYEKVQNTAKWMDRGTMAARVGVGVGVGGGALYGGNKLHNAYMNQGQEQVQSYYQ